MEVNLGQVFIVGAICLAAYIVLTVRDRLDRIIKLLGTKAGMMETINVLLSRLSEGKKEGE